MARRKYLSLDGEEFQVLEQEMLKFQDTIEKMVKDTKSTHLDAIQTYCEKNNIDIETVSSLISPSLKEILTQEALELNMLKRSDEERSVFDF